MKCKDVVDHTKALIGYRVGCPACTEAGQGSAHVFYVRSYTEKLNGTQGWQFDGDYERPTFSPSMLAHGHKARCHSFVRNGRIEYLSDCTHAYAGQTIGLPDVESWPPPESP